MKKTYNISLNLAKIVGFEAAALHSSFEGQKVVTTSYNQICKENPCWTRGKTNKLFEALEAVGAVSRTPEVKGKFDVTVYDTITKPTETEVVDNREAKKYIIVVPEDGQGPTEKEVSGNAIVSSIIDKLTVINPDAVKFYRWKHERAAILDMLDQGYDPTVMIHYASLLPMTHGQPFAPVITSPKEFATKFSKLAAYIHKEVISKKQEQESQFVF